VEVQVTRAEEKDFGYIQEKIEKYALDGSKLDWRQFFVAKTGEKVVAFGRIIDFGDFFEIASLGVDYYHRKKGLGKVMLTFLIQEARKKEAQKPIYGVTHVPEFVASCGFVPTEDDYPDYLDHKRKHGCRLHASKIKIVKWQDSA